MTTNEHNNEPENQPLIEKPKDEKEKEDIFELYDDSNKNKTFWEKILVILLSVLVLLLKLVFSFILSFIFIYYKTNKDIKECKAMMYEKINNILYIYLVLLIIFLLEILCGIINELAKKDYKNIIKFINNIYIILRVVSTIMSIVLLIVVQAYYSKSKSWKNCGNFKPWSVVWLVLNYIGIFFLLLYLCCFGLLKAALV